MQYNPIALTDSYGTVDKYFGDLLKSLGYSGNVLGANQSFFSANPEDMGSMSATSIDPAFQKWAQANGISTSMGKGDDYNIMQLLQNGNVVGEKKYSTKDGLDKFAEVAGPIALAIGTGGVLGQALGFIPAGLNPIDPATWGAASGASGGAIASGGAKGAASLEAAVAADLAASQAAAAASVGTGAGLTATELAALGAGGAAAGGAAGGMLNGAFLGEGVASGIPAWDAAKGSGAQLTPSGLTGLLGKAWDFAKENPRLAGGLLGGLLGGSGGGSGGGYSYNGPMPTISRQGWNPTAQANLMPTQSVVQGLPQAQGQQYSGLLRYLGG